ncbi:hypothetical protein DM02DRAFT_311773 [Periconia macrospinosa]|uniref:NAD(P)-binding domain-containing protein n=1 Tax=Periconia macrospinosa TaxID=97972 RepID=A0A2V1D3R0_9PLEO|nr:hypothetical protein DM02DRAFT_311773 [Periconia macrospinosa]
MVLFCFQATYIIHHHINLPIPALPFFPPSSLTNPTQGETETKVLSYAASHGSSLEVAIAKPGLIVEPGNIAKQVLTTGLGWTGVVPSVGLRDISKALLDQVVGGFEKETLENADLVRLGRED